MGVGLAVAVAVAVAVALGVVVDVAVAVAVGVDEGVPVAVAVGVALAGVVGVGVHPAKMWHQVMLTVSTRQPSLEPLLSLAMRQRSLACVCTNGMLTTVVMKPSELPLQA